MRVVRHAGGARARRSRPRSARPRRPSASATSTSRSTSSRPRHIEFQVLGDHHGNVVHLGERECSIQRRHQKLHRGVAVGRRSPRRCAARWAAIVVDAARAVQYTNAGTFEFLMDADGQLLLHGGEHAPPGRAPGHRDGDRHRHRQGADPDRGRRAAVVQAERGHLHRATRSSAASTPRIPDTFAPVAGHDPRVQRAGRPGRARRHVRALRVHDLAVLRLDDRQDHRARPRPPGGDRAHAAHARDDGHRGHQDDDSAAPARSCADPDFVAGRLSTAFMDGSCRERSRRPRADDRLQAAVRDACRRSTAIARRRRRRAARGWTVPDAGARVPATAAPACCRCAPSACPSRALLDVADAIVARGRALRRDGHRQRSRRHRAHGGRRRRARRAGRPARPRRARSSGRRAIVGLSTHTRGAGRRGARASRVTYVAVGPVFGTATKDTGYDAVGLDLVRACGRARRGGRCRSWPSAASRSTRAAAVLAAGAAQRRGRSAICSSGPTRDARPRVRAAGTADALSERSLERPSSRADLSIRRLPGVPRSRRARIMRDELADASALDPPGG